MFVRQVHLFIFMIIHQLLSYHLEPSAAEKGKNMYNRSQVRRSFGFSPESILGFGRTSTSRMAEINKFKYENCGSDKSPIQFMRLNAVASPSREITITLHVNVSSTLRAPIKIISNIQKHTWIGWVTIPCVNNMGSCVVEDMCPFGTIKCPFEVLTVNGIPCSCPIKKGSYIIDDGVFPLPNIPLTSLMSGSYKVKVRIEDGANKTLGCVEATLDLQIT